MKKITLLILAAIICCACNSKIEVRNGVVYYDNAAVGELTCEACEGVEYSDKARSIDDATIKITRTFTATEDVDSARLTLNFRHLSPCTYVMIPSVCYNGNHWGRGREPKGYQTDGVWHTYSYRRTPIPGATFSEGESVAVAMWSDLPKCEAEAFSCAIMPEEESVTHSLIFPEEERPFTYVAKNRYAAPYTQKLSLRKGETQTLVAYLHITPTDNEHYTAAAFLDKAWELADKKPATVPSAEKVWEYGVRYAKEELWAEEGDYRGFSIGLLPDGKGGWRQRTFMKYEIGWCGQNASFINSLLTDFLKYGNEESKQKALTALQTWTSPALQRANGFYVANYDNILGGRTNIISDACNLGTAASNFFETAQLLKECNLPELCDTVAQIAYNICDFARGDQQPSGVYGKGWTESGECLYREGTVGAFLIPPMLSAYQLSGNEEYLTSATKAYDYYFGEFAETGYTTAGALDTWCIDKESSISLLRAALRLYDITRENTYIQNAERISQYLSTWLWHYAASFEDDAEINRHDFTTFGATSVSVQHHHLDVYALLWVGEWLRLAEITGNDIWREKALAIWSYGCQLISDGTLTVNNLRRPVGSQNEAFLNCEWEHTAGKPRNNDWLVAWPGAFRLETLRHLDDWSVLNTLK